MMENKVVFERKLGAKGRVMGISIPIELQEYLEIEEGNTIQMFGEIGKHGKFISMWKKDDRR